MYFSAIISILSDSDDDVPVEVERPKKIPKVRIPE